MVMVFAPQFIIAQSEMSLDSEVNRKVHATGKQKTAGKKVSASALAQVQRHATIKHMEVVLNALGKITKPTKANTKISLNSLKQKDLANLADSLCTALEHHPEQERILSNKPLLQDLRKLPSKKVRAEHIEQLTNSRGILSYLAIEIFEAINECMDFCSSIVTQTVHFILAPFAPKPVQPAPMPAPSSETNTSSEDDVWDDSEDWEEDADNDNNTENWSE